MTKWKTSDITQQQVLEAFAKKGGFRDEALIRETGAPPKVVEAAMMREERLGNIDCGVSLRSGWLTNQGKATLAELRGHRSEEAAGIRP
jgi:hypothetical protein